MLLTERQIDLRLKCPMFGMEDQHGPSSYECAQKLLRWAVLNAFKGRLVPVATLRGKFESIWNGHTAGWAPDHQPAYYAGLRAGNTAARKIFLFLQHYEVLKPVEAYSVDLAGDRIEGEYAVVLRRHDRRTDERPMILQAHEWRPAYCQQPGADRADSVRASDGSYRLHVSRGLPPAVVPRRALEDEGLRPAFGTQGSCFHTERCSEYRPSGAWFSLRGLHREELQEPRTCLKHCPFS